MAKIALFGLGPVGLATAYQLLHAGHEVHGYDSDKRLMKDLQKGHFTRAKDLGDDLNRFKNRLFFYHEDISLLPKPDIRIICVGTPSRGDDLDYSSLISIFEQTLDANKFGGDPNYILRSTLRPGTIEKIILPILENRKSYQLSYYPEFLREKFIRDDVANPPISVACHSSDLAKSNFQSVFSAPVEEVKTFTEAEAIKMFSNTFHSLKVVFANEVSDICEELFIDGENVMKILCSDKKLNISDAYLKPGGPFSGHCLEKDLKSLESFVQEKAIVSPLISAIRKSNDLRKLHERFSGDT
jgi:GDP-mannose 6-dehydrogenase